MKKLITISMLLVMTILGIVFGYENLKMEDVVDENYVKIPYLQDEEPVSTTVMTFGKPFNDENVKILVGFYDYQKDNQENSIIVIDKTYIPNKGILYKNDKAFDVLAIYDGEVLEVSKDDLTGNYIKVKHSDNLIATYNILSEVNVKEKDKIKKGDKLGVSGTSQIGEGNLLLFEIESSNLKVNPEDYYNKSIKEI